MISINPRYPSIEDLKKKAAKRIPKFVFDYLEGGCNEDVNLSKNRIDLHEVELKPSYLRKHAIPDMHVKLFGRNYDAPFGIAPIGLQGLIWPNAPEILAKAAYLANVPYTLSTVSTSSIERIAELTCGNAWFQLYHPVENALRDAIIKRAADAQIKVLVVLVDVPSFGFRPRDIKNGLSMRPRMTIKNAIQILSKPVWGVETLKTGTPRFETLTPYIPKGLSMNKLGHFMDKTFDGGIDEEKIKSIRDLWKGALVLKGIVNEEDAEIAMRLGVDGIIVSNHGGRQIDTGESAIRSLRRIAEHCKKKVKVMIDSGLSSGPDVARCLASGADFTFMGRSFMYGVGALGKKGGDHTINLFKVQLKQVMEQLGCATIDEFPKFLIK